MTFFAIRRLKKEDSETSKFKLSVLVPKEPKAASEEQADFHMHFTCTFLLQSKAIGTCGHDTGCTGSHRQPKCGNVCDSTQNHKGFTMVVSPTARVPFKFW